MASGEGNKPRKQAAAKQSVQIKGSQAPQGNAEERLPSGDSLEAMQDSREKLRSETNLPEDRANSFAAGFDDFDNLMICGDIGAIFLDGELRVKKLTPAIDHLFPQLPLRVGCRLEEIAESLEGFSFLEDSCRALRTLQSVEKEIETQEERWLLQRVFPYRTGDNRVEGAVITFTDVTDIKNMERRASRRAGFLKLLTDALPVRMAYIDTEERYRYANDLYISWLGLPREKVIGSTLLDVLGREIYKTIKPNIRQALGGERNNFETALDYKGAGFRQVLVECAPHLDDSGRVIGVFGVILDITDRKEAERNNAWLATIVEFSGDAILSGDFDGTVRSWNKAAERIYGYRADEIVGSNVSRLIPEGMAEDLQKAVVELRQGRSVPPFEAKRIRKDGTTVDVLVTLSPILDSAGSPVAVSIISHDISERKAMETALRKQELLHRTIGETIPFGTWTADPEGRMTHVAQIFLDMSGLTMEEMAEFGWLERVPAEDRQVVKDSWMHSIANGEDWTSEYRFLGAEGIFYDIYSIGRPVRDDSGNILYWAGFHLDNTERKRVEKQLHELNRTLEEKIAERTNSLEQHMVQLRRLALELTQTEERERQRLARVLHDDLQQLLVAAGLRVERLESKIKDETLLDILAETEDLLGKASSTARNLATDLRPPMLSDSNFIEGLRWLVDWIWQRFDLAVHLEIMDNFNPKLIPAELGAYLFATIRELLFNVVKHAQVKIARLRLGLDDRRCLLLKVIDQGVGSERDDLGRPLAMAQGTGLRSIRERLQLMGGTLQIRTGQGKGFQVDIHLPYPLEAGGEVQCGVETKGPEFDKGISNDAGERPMAPIRIMLVDDHRIVRDGLRMILQEEDDFYVVAEASDGREAIAVAREKRPDVIIMDINMPEMNGIEATRLIKKEMPATQIIGLSINDDTASQDAMLEVGACGYHVKSGPSEILCRTVRSCCGREAFSAGRRTLIH